MKIFHTVNNGFYFQKDDTGIFFDGIHKGHAYGFSDTPEEIIDKCYALEDPFEKLKALFFTHKHKDHFDADAAEVIVKRNKLWLYAPEYPKNNIEERKADTGVSEINVGPARIYAIKTRHDGKKEYMRVPHVSFVINTAGESFFIAGDAAFDPPEAEKIKGLLLGGCAAAFANPYQIISDSGKEVLNALNPKIIIIAHMPFEEDDAYNLRTLLKTARGQFNKLNAEVIIPGYNEWIF